MADLVGTSIGQYQIVERLGRGGMATVYKGYQPALERYVAVKVLDPTVSSEELFLARFQREARAVALLRHPHIVQIYDFGHINDMYYMVMEYVDGQSLRERLKTAISESRFMPIQEVLGIVWSIASALDYANQRGIIHRDIKPGNILLSSDGQAVLSDFGIAQMITSSRLTLSGLVGTPNYMSPEQGQGLDIDQRTDIYSLGIVTYEMFTNQVPFSSDTPFAVVMAHVTRPLPSLRKYRPDIPAAAEDVLVKATAKEKEQRYYRAMEFAESLEVAFASVLESAASIKEGVMFCPRCRAPLEAGQRFCGKCGAHLNAPATAVKTTSAKVPTELKAPEPVELTADTPPRPVKPLSVSSRPAGKKLDRPPAPPEAVAPVPASKERRGKTGPLAFIAIALGVLIVLAALGAGAMTLLPRPQQTEVAEAQPTATTKPQATPTERITASTIVTSTGSLNVTASSAATETVSEPTKVSATTSTPATSATMAKSTSSATLATKETTGVTLAATKAPVLTPTETKAPAATPTEAKTVVTTPTETEAPAATPTKASSPGLTPTSTVYIGPVLPTASGTVTVGVTDTITATSTRRPSTPKPTVQDIRGKILFKTDRDGAETIYVMNPDGTNQEPLQNVEAYQAALDRESLSPDGTERLFANNNADNWDIYMIPADGHKSPMAITSHAADDYDAVWSPVENLIAFVSLRTEGKDAIFLMTPDGRNDRQITFNKNALDKHPTWSPDGAQIAFSSDRDGRRQIYVINKDGNQQMNISNSSSNDWDPIWVK